MYGVDRVIASRAVRRTLEKRETAEAHLGGAPEVAESVENVGDGGLAMTRS